VLLLRPGDISHVRAETSSFVAGEREIREGLAYRSPCGGAGPDSLRGAVGVRVRDACLCVRGESVACGQPRMLGALRRYRSYEG
jgi:hypothetical protein